MEREEKVKMKNEKAGLRIGENGKEQMRRTGLRNENRGEGGLREEPNIAYHLRPKKNRRKAVREFQQATGHAFTKP